MFDWNDLRYFLAVADAGSTLKAARKLGANQTTVARRIGALEDALGQKLFERRKAGYSLSQAGERLLDKARAVAAAASAIDVDAAKTNRDVSGTVRVTANEIFCEIVLPPMLLELRERYPQIRIEVEQNQHALDLASGEADIGIRYFFKSTDNALIRRKLFDDRFAIICSQSYAKRVGKPSGPADLANHSYIGGGGSHYWPLMKAWLDEVAPGLEPAMTVDTLTSLLSSIRAGLGVAGINQFIFEGEPDLVPCWRTTRDFPLWICIHERSRDLPHVRIVMKELGDMMVAEARRRGL